MRERNPVQPASERRVVLQKTVSALCAYRRHTRSGQLVRTRCHY